MNLINQIHKKSWTVIIAFIPVLNLVYLISCFIVTDLNYRFYIWSVPIAAFFAAALQLTSVRKSFIFGLFVFAAVLSFISYVWCKKHSLDKAKRVWPRVTILVIISVVTIAGLMVSQLFNPLNKTTQKTKEAMEIIVNQDKENWKKQLHMYAEKSIESVSAVKKKLRDSGVELTGEVSEINIISYNSETEKKAIKDETVTTFKAEAVVGGRSYIVEIVFVENEYGNGIKKFDMYPWVDNGKNAEKE